MFNFYSFDLPNTHNLFSKLVCGDVVYTIWTCDEGHKVLIDIDNEVVGMSTLTRGPKPVYYLIGKQAQGNAHPRCWTIISSSTKPQFILNELESLAKKPKSAYYYTELMIVLDMGSIKL